MLLGHPDLNEASVSSRDYVRSALLQRRKRGPDVACVSAAHIHGPVDAIPVPDLWSRVNGRGDATRSSCRELHALRVLHFCRSRDKVVRSAPPLAVLCEADAPCSDKQQSGNQAPWRVCSHRDYQRLHCDDKLSRVKLARHRASGRLHHDWRKRTEASLVGIPQQLDRITRQLLRQAPARWLTSEHERIL